MLHRSLIEGGGQCHPPAHPSIQHKQTHPLEIAKAAMITSVALPKVAFNSPPIESLVYMASCSVIMPRRCSGGVVGWLEGDDVAVAVVGGPRVVPGALPV